MELTLTTLALLIPPFLLIEGFFSGSEIALLSADKLTLKARAGQGSQRAKLALELANHPERILSSTLLMTSLCVISISSLISLYVHKIGSRHADLIAIAITSPLVVLLGELIPKTIYQKYATKLAPWVAPAVQSIFWIFYPVTRILSGYTSRLSRLLGPIEELLTGKRQGMREEIRQLLSYSRKESEIKSSERKMIKRIFDFKDTEAKHALIPLIKVEAIAEASTIAEALERFKSHRHSRMPVFSGRIDNIVGVLEISDLFLAADTTQTIRAHITPAHYVAETQSLEDLLQEMRIEESEMVVVVDEYGGAVGVLTFEDIVEEIVGEISDEHDTDVNTHKQMGENSWLVQAKMEILQINEDLKLELPEGEYETLGGFLLQQFGRIPELADDLYFNTPAGSLKFTVRKASDRQIELVLIELTPSPSRDDRDGHEATPKD
ncbi:MAG: HlyC/CorC family transporter [Methylotenera sp.]|nr:HlyC/CorC family transporter [Oligoflexia bacterium]